MNKDTIGLTSKGSAAARTYESKRVDALFIDPFASIYASQTDDEPSENVNHIGGKVDRVDNEQTSCFPKVSLRTKIANMALRSTTLRTFGTGRLIGMNKIGQIFEDVAVRTRFLDDIIQKNISNVKQIVLLACGGDFRPYRLTSLSSTSCSSDLTFYLLDVPHVLTYRQKCFAQLNVPPTTIWCVVEVPCDLSGEEWSQKLLEVGFDINQPTLWLAEGFFEYLTEQQNESLFNQIRQLSSTKQSCIAFDLVSTRFQTSFRHVVTGGLFQFALDDKNEVHRIFARLGCDDIECTSFHELGTMYGRSVSRNRSFIVTAKIRPAET